MRRINLHNRPTEKISRHILYMLVALIVLVFALFYFVGYDLPYLEDPSFTAPLFTNAVIILMVMQAVLTLAATAFSVFRSVSKAGKTNGQENNIPTRKLAYGFTSVTLVLLIVTYLSGSTTSLKINGNTFTDIFWLKLADMFINTALILICLAMAAVVFGATRYYRKRRKAQ